MNSTAVAATVVNKMYFNITTGEYIENFKISQLKRILKKNTKSECLLKEDIGESHWRRTDRIVVVPPHCEDYVRKQYSQLYLN